MKICLFSDIHGNKAAMEAALSLLINEQADLNIFLGDICGYYFGALEVWESFEKLPALVSILGNHDRLFLQFLDAGAVPASYTQKYGPALLELFMQRDTSQVKQFAAWLRTLPESYVDKGLGLTCHHASPQSQDGKDAYIYPDAPLPAGTFPLLVLLGHTHYAMYRRRGETLFCNPGSLGQPRGGAQPTYATLVLPEKRWLLHTVSYDVRAFVASLDLHRPFPDYLTDVLARSSHEAY